jgi:phosphohistidine phosphatase
VLLVLLRHGPAADRDPGLWPDDALRPLTARGRERTRRAAAGLARLIRGEVRALLTSPLVRCVQTARIAADELGSPKPVEADELAPGGSFDELLEDLPPAAEEEALVLVGHEPDLGRAAGRLVLGEQAELPLKKAGACAIAFDGRPVAGDGRLVWHVTPRILRRLAR